MIQLRQFHVDWAVLWLSILPFHLLWIGKVQSKTWQLTTSINGNKHWALAWNSSIKKFKQHGQHEKYHVCADLGECLQLTGISLLHINSEGARSVEHLSLDTWYGITLWKHNHALLIVHFSILHIRCKSLPWQGNGERKTLINL